MERTDADGTWTSDDGGGCWQLQTPSPAWIESANAPGPLTPTPGLRTTDPLSTDLRS